MTSADPPVDPSVGPSVGPSPPTGWQSATVVGIHRETDRATTFRLQLAEPRLHRAGQHVVLRLTAPDGYTASRSYSIASAPDPGGLIDLTVERLDDGEVSSFLHDVVEIGDELDVRGPIGGWFAWDVDEPVLLVGGGPGVVPLMAMLRHARTLGRADLLRLVVSVRSADDLCYRGEVEGPQTTVVHTRVAPPGDRRPAGRLGPADLAPLLDVERTCFVCGSASFADAASRLLVELGVDRARIRVERFGPSGGT